MLTNRRGTTVELVDRGATLLRIALAGESSRVRDVVVGPANYAALVAMPRRYGGIVGRYAGRLRGHVTIAGRRHDLATNANGLTLHGGDPGFDRAMWTSVPFQTRDVVGVVFTHVSRDGDQRFPGTLTVTARYALSRDSDTLTLDIVATSDRPTVANLTNHVYFDLSGGAGLACQTLAVDAAKRIALDARKLPMGAFEPVAIRLPHALATAVAAGGIDEMFVLGPTRTARLVDRASGLRLTLTTDQPGLQVYTGNGFDGSDRDRVGRPILRFAGIALEPSNFPDAPNVAGFPDAVVAPGKPYRWRTMWRFDRTGSRPCH
ncbi:aldose epimerase family protein [uncultured Sphingomonas sp.]|uniref:aldose epimerase family protein n=1 Tax=uncultured Sphingomonas sp. TaxID=158754 RepID=UPI0025E6BCE0|nr:aldose epimerase family protein [uncultured Sphingomonas sp.]